MDDRAKLAALIREAAVPLEPELPVLPPRWEELAACSTARAYDAMLFDVYGTLFCSAAGDIGMARDAERRVSNNAALDALAGDFGLEMFGEELRLFFRRKVEEAHGRLKNIAQWPEVRVEEIWGDLPLERDPGQGNAENRLREFALRYELAVNPVYPMPGAARTIAALKEAGCTLGIISNAQFFTPLLFDAFFGAAPGQLGFDADLLFYSYEWGEAKPSPRLFDMARRRLEERGIAAGDCGFVGNDMRADIYGAAAAGFQGILFAGDKRSLRLREDDALAGSLKPSRIIRSLDELVPAAQSPPPFCR